MARPSKLLDWSRLDSVDRYIHITETKDQQLIKKAALQDPDPTVRCAAVRRYVEIRKKQFIKSYTLKKVIKFDPDLGVVLTAIELMNDWVWLYEMFLKETSPTKKSALRDRIRDAALGFPWDGWDAEQAAEAFHRLATQDEFILLLFLYAPKVWMRRRMIGRVKLIGFEKVVKALNDEDSVVAVAAATMLKKAHLDLVLYDPQIKMHPDAREKLKRRAARAEELKKLAVNPYRIKE